MSKEPSFYDGNTPLTGLAKFSLSAPSLLGNLTKTGIIVGCDIQMLAVSSKCWLCHPNVGCVIPTLAVSSKFD